MAIKQILKIGDPLLRNKSENVLEDEVKTKEFKKLIKDLFDTMKFAQGVGLAAPQIGVLKKIVVVGAEKNERYPNSPDVPSQIIINPIIKPITKELSGMWEGCLSVPKMRGFVERPNKIKMTWRDENWKEYQEEISGFKAIVYQHETDHLEGILYVDRLKDIKLFGFEDSLKEEGDRLD